MADTEKMSAVEKLFVKINAPKLDNKVSFYNLMAVTQKAWLWVRDSLDSILKWENHPGMRKIIQDLIDQTNEWTSLAEAMEEHSYFFWNEEISLIRSSESMWNLPEVLENLSFELENFQKLKWKIKSSMMYPWMVLWFAAIAVVILLVYVMPNIIDMFPSEEELPWITLFMLWASDFLQDYWFILMLIIGWAVWAYTYSYRYILPFKIFMDKMFISAPIIGGVVRKFNLYRFSKLLGDFYNAWVSPTEALSQISDILKNYHYKVKVNSIKNDLEVWLNFVESMEGSTLFDPILIQIIWIWESTWNVGEVLEKISKFYRDDLDTKLDGMTKMLEPLVMAFVAIIIWLIVASVFLPMGELIGQLDGM